MDGREVKTGEILFREGEPSDSVYLIPDGEVEVLREAGDRRGRRAAVAAGLAGSGEPDRPQRPGG
jgi:CRP-like cAMP-binding protein